MQVSESVRRCSDPTVAIDVSIVVPAYNESERLPRLMRALTETVDRAGVELVVVDDGSTDATSRVASQLLDRHGWNGRVVTFPVNRGKGAAVRVGIGIARGGAIVVMDADLATDLRAFAPAVDALVDHDIAVGVRSSIDHGRAVHRRLMTAAFGRWVRATTSVSLTDTQCGFKAYRAPAATLLFAASRADGFAQDAEVLDLATHLGMAIAEIPVRWSAVAGSKVRAVRDSWWTAFELARHRVRRHRVELVAVTVRSGRLSVDELAVLVRPHVRRTDVVHRSGDALFILAAGAPEIAHRRIVARLGRAIDGLDATVAAVPLASLAEESSPAAR
ncbi:MAG: glycosyltransferase [Acidimicrobiales bacterium]